MPKQRYLLEVLPEDPRRVRSGRGVARITLLALKFGRSVELWPAIFASGADLRELAKSPKALLHLAELLVQYLMSVNPDLTADKLSETTNPRQ